jgi:sialate O-acetylesterase
MPDDMSTVPQGFSIAGESGKFYLGHAAYPPKRDAGIWNVANKNYDTTKVIVWSPLVEEPVAVRYAWATSPLGNLKVNGKPWSPLASFRTDEWDWPESNDPTESLVDRGKSREMNNEAAERCEYRRTEEAGRATEILERLKTLGNENDATTQ